MKRLLTILLVACAAIFLGERVLAVEEPAYRTVLKQGDYEIRDYPALVVAETQASGDQSQAGSQGFRALAGYIFGGNRNQRKIAMTAPVGMTQAGSDWTVTFTMPSGSTLATLPKPDNSDVTLRETPPTRYAVLRFSGYARPATVAEKTAELKAWMESRKLKATGPVTLAQYNPPWTLWFLRRNEVWAPVES
jgi:DNA gyrase inhibitor GyrI